MSILSISDNINRSYMNISTGKKVNNAADNAAALAIIQGIQSQTIGYSIGTNNAKDGQNFINVADGALSSITDSLQRMKEISVQASNGIYTAEDRQFMQYEIDQLKEHITDVAKNTEFNTIKVLDGGKADINLATNPSGLGMTIHTANTTLETLGIADFDVTKDFNMSDIDNAIKKISNSRSSLGAQSNRLDYTIDYNQTASINLTASQDRMEASDIAEEITNISTQKVLEQYAYFAQAQKQHQQSSLLSLFQMM